MGRIPPAPVVRSVEVAADIDKAFRVFTERIGEWWPLDTHSIFQGRASNCVIEPRAGGRVYEVSVDGDEASWGEVLEFDPPKTFVLAWKPNTRPTPPTRVQVTFTARGDLTQVELVHTAWEVLGEEAEEARAGYDEGWTPTLERFRAAIDNL